MDNKADMVPALGAVLFAGGEPVEMATLCRVFDTTENDINESLRELEARLAGSGIKLLRLAGSFQLASDKIFAEYIRSAFDLKRKQPLSQAAFEVLAVIAYNQPVTRAFVEQVRGVDCSGVIASLVEKGLIEERGRLDLPGKPLLYGTTPHFLRCFSLTCLDDLPPLPERPAEPDNGENV